MLIALLVFVFSGGIWIWLHQGELGVASWYASPQRDHMNLTLTGYWFVYVSVPVSQFILLEYAHSDLVLVFCCGCHF